MLTKKQIVALVNQANDAEPNLYQFLCAKGVDPDIADAAQEWLSERFYKATQDYDGIVEGLIADAEFAMEQLVTDFEDSLKKYAKRWTP